MADMFARAARSHRADRTNTVGSADDVTELMARFEHFADTSTRHTPLYAAISRRVSDEPDVAALLLHAEAGQRIPVLLLAAVHDLLLSGLDHPLSACYPTVVDEPTGTPHEAADLFVDLCRRHQDLVVALVASRSTQTNEIGRSAALRPVLVHLARRHGLLGLVEVGASAGLNLWFDRYRVDYELAGATHEAGPSTSTVRLRCGLVDDADLPLAPDPDVAGRVGLDRSPVDLADPIQDRWLLACTWPDELERFHRLQAAIQLARTEPSPVVRGDAVDDLATHVLAVPTDAHPVVFHSWVLSYLHEDRQRAFAAEVARLGRLRPLSYVWMESRDLVPGLPAPERAVEREGATEVVLVEHGHGDARPVRLAEMHPHGRWLHWQAPVERLPSTSSPVPPSSAPGSGSTSIRTVWRATDAPSPTRC